MMISPTAIVQEEELVTATVPDVPDEYVIVMKALPFFLIEKTVLAVGAVPQAALWSEAVVDIVKALTAIYLAAISFIGDLP